MNVSSSTQSTKLTPFKNNEPSPGSLDYYIDHSQDILTLGSRLQANSRQKKLLAACFITVLTAAPFIPASLPILAVGLIFATVIAAAFAIKLYKNSQQLHKVRTDFGEMALEFEKKIFEKVIVELPQILEGTYDTNEGVQSSTLDEYHPYPHSWTVHEKHFKKNADISQIRERLTTWAKEFRFAGAFPDVSIGVRKLYWTQKPVTEEEILFNQLYSAFDNNILDTQVNYIFHEIKKILNIKNNTEITSLIDKIKIVTNIYDQEIEYYSEIAHKLSVNVQRFPEDPKSVPVYPEAKKPKPFHNDTPLPEEIEQI